MPACLFSPAESSNNGPFAAQTGMLLTASPDIVEGLLDAPYPEANAPAFYKHSLEVALLELQAKT